MKPQGELVLAAIAMPMHTNVNGDIFGGWLLSQMDLAGAAFCRTLAHTRFVTVAIQSMEFLVPVHVGDTVDCYVSVEKVGRTSVTTKIEVWVNRFDQADEEKVTEGVFVYVGIDKNGQPCPVNEKIVAQS